MPEEPEEKESKKKEPVKEEEKEEAIEEVEEIPEELKEEIPEIEEKIVTKEEEKLLEWQPATNLGRKVMSGEITDIEEILKSGQRISESEIVDKLIPNLKSELILIGGRTGKGGGIQRIPVKITAKMHKSGRRFRASSLVVVGNEDGIVGVGKASAVEPREAIEKAIGKAKVNIIKIKRGCGSWECGCGTEHSIPYKIKGKSGSVRVTLMPAPKGVGLVADDESKKLLRLAGIKDVWVKTFGNTGMRINLISAIFEALRKLYIYEKVSE